jgi:hypothetical protein
MGEVVRFVPKSELERARLIGEARAIYESIFPTLKDPGSQNGDSLVAKADIGQNTPLSLGFQAGLSDVATRPSVGRHLFRS